MGGVTADELAPQDNINRASTVTILDRAISTYADQAGESVKADGKGLVLVVVENVKITGAPEGTKVVVADGATGLTVNGKSVSDDQTYIAPKTTTSSGSSSSDGSSHSHTIAAAWSYDDTYHWHEASCKIADHRSGKDAHTFDEATGACECGFTKCVEVRAAYNSSNGKRYATIVEAANNLDGNEWIAITGNYTLSSDYIIPDGVGIDVQSGATFTIPADVTLTVAAGAKRLGIMSGSTVVNNGTILVKGRGTDFSESKVMAQNGANFDVNKLSVPTNYLSAI